MQWHKHGHICWTTHILRPVKSGVEDRVGKESFGQLSFWKAFEPVYMLWILFIKNLLRFCTMFSALVFKILCCVQLNVNICQLGCIACIHHSECIVYIHFQVEIANDLYKSCSYTLTKYIISRWTTIIFLNSRYFFIKFKMKYVKFMYYFSSL